MKLIEKVRGLADYCTGALAVALFGLSVVGSEIGGATNAVVKFKYGLH